MSAPLCTKVGVSLEVKSLCVLEDICYECTMHCLCPFERGFEVIGLVVIFTRGEMPS